MTQADRPPEDQIADLRQAIAGLEAQRAALGNAVVGTALAALQAKLAALQGQAAEQRKLVSIVFADLAGFTALSETLDPEDIREIQQDYFARWRQAIEGHGGVVEKFIGDAVMALFGVPATKEDDAERAVRAALALHVGLVGLNAERSTRLQMRAGVHTGPVVVAGAAGDFVATGDAVNLTARLQSNAPPGGTLISHETYQQVRGLFDVAAQPPLAVKGKAEPIDTYLVQAERPAAFRAMMRGVEGVATRMIGRELEMQALQKAWADVLDEHTAQLVLVVGEPGLGKSRLADEFGLWLVDQDQPLHALRGRATPQSISTPAAVLRQTLGASFAIDDADSPDVMQTRFRRGVAPTLTAEEADVLGQFCGFDFSASPAVSRLLGQDALAHMGRTYLNRYIEGLGRDRPLLLLVEDLHWADDRSLDALLALVSPVPLAPLLVVALTRPALFERRPHWGEGLPAITRLTLRPLSRRDGRALVSEILQNVESLPDDLRDLIVTASEGNPFFAEELVKMLADDGVIAVVAGGRWQVQVERLAGLRVPATLAGVLQARLDSLPAAERVTLQQAAVVGREFWDEAVAAIGQAERGQVAPLLAALRGRELVYRHEHSVFAETAEFAFKHALLRDVTYETVLKRLRRRYHLQVAEWLEQRAGERTAEHAGLIAYHYQQAGANPQALKFLTLAAESALSRYANPEAAAYYQQALDILRAQPAGPGDAAAPTHELASLLSGLGRALARQDDYTAAEAAWSEALELFHKLGDTDQAARLHARLSRAAWYRHELASALDIASRAIERLRGAPASPGLAALHHEVGRAAMFVGQSDLAFAQTTVGLEQAEELGLPDVQADALVTLSQMSRLTFAEQVAAIERALPLAEAAGSLVSLHRALINFTRHIGRRGHSGDQQAAIRTAERANQLAHQRGSNSDILFSVYWLSGAYSAAGQLRAARELLEEMRARYQAQPEPRDSEVELLTNEARYQKTIGNFEQCLVTGQLLLTLAHAQNRPNLEGDFNWEIGHVLALLGRLDEADAAMQAGAEIESRLPVKLGGVEWEPWQAAVSAWLRAAQGRHAEAAELLTEAWKRAGPEPSNWKLLTVLPHQAYAAAQRGDWDAALADYQKTLDINQTAGWVLNYSVALMEMAGVYLARNAPGDLARGRAMLEDSLARFEAMEAEGYAGRVKEKLKQV